MKVCAREGCVTQVGSARAKYCSDTCRNTQKSRNARAKARAYQKAESARPARGEIATELKRRPQLIEGYRQGELSATDIARLLDVGERSVRDSLAGIFVDEVDHTWERTLDIEHLLGVDLDNQIRASSGETRDQLLDEATTRFIAFEQEFFRLPGNQHFIRKDFHLRWIKALLYALLTGNKQMILSPPRHGKSELLAHFAVWLIVRNPDIRIAWIGPNQDIAADMVGSVRTHLEDNERLIAATLPPGQAYRPKGKVGATWTNNIFQVGVRSEWGQMQKAKTMVALGRTTKILSRDIDLIVADDIEDHITTENDSSREQTRRWFLTQLDSRKMKHTGFVVIGSRQHPSDLYSVLLETPSWKSSIVESAHSPECTKDEAAIEEHTDCTLFPELCDYEWLYDKLQSARVAGQEGQYEMVYLNQPRPLGLVVFEREAIEACYNANRSLGIEGLPPDYQLVAGLDPAATGYQAAFLWAWSRAENKMYMVDIENHKGGGFDNALRIMREWLGVYGVQHWVIETNLFHGALISHPPIVEFASANSIYIEPHETRWNKRDAIFGVGGMSTFYREGQVDLPYNGTAARERTLLYTRQMLAFTDHVMEMRKRNRARSDVLMASWFPMRTIRRWQKEWAAEAGLEYRPAYPGLDQSPLDNVPW